MFLIEPALRVVDLGANSVRTSGANLIAKLSTVRIEYLALPGNEMYELGCNVAYRGIWREMTVPSPSPIGIGPADDARNSSSSWSCDISKRSVAVRVTVCTSPSECRLCIDAADHRGAINWPANASASATASRPSAIATWKQRRRT